MITKEQIIGLLKWYDDNRDYLNEIGADFDKTADKAINTPDIVNLFAIPVVNGWHLFSDKTPEIGNMIEIYWSDKSIEKCEYKNISYGCVITPVFWRACR